MKNNQVIEIINNINTANNAQVLEAVEHVNTLLIDSLTQSKRLLKTKYLNLSKIIYILDYICLAHDNLLKTRGLDSSTVFYIDSTNKCIFDFFNLNRVSTSDIDNLKLNFKKLKSTLTAK